MIDYSTIVITLDYEYVLDNCVRLQQPIGRSAVVWKVCIRHLEAGYLQKVHVARQNRRRSYEVIDWGASSVSVVADL